MNYFDSIYSDSLPSRAVTVYLYLVQRANSDGQCWPSERRIALDLSISKSTVKRAITDLVKNGYIKTEQRYRKSGAKSSLLFTIINFKKSLVPRDSSAY
jgi:DNA-binding GntR family transcriptional regulator